MLFNTTHPTQEDIMNSAISLETVAQHFVTWRTSSQTKGRSVTPIHLQQEAVTLKSNYSKKEITKALGINHSALKRWSATQEATNPGFIALAAEDIDVAMEVASGNARCEFPNGIRLTLPINRLGSTLLLQLYEMRQAVKS